MKLLIHSGHEMIRIMLIPGSLQIRVPGFFHLHPEKKDVRKTAKQKRKGILRAGHETGFGCCGFRRVYMQLVRSS